MNETLREAVAAVVAARAAADESRAEMRALADAWDEAHAEQIERSANVRNAVDDAEAGLRAAAVAAWGKLPPGSPKKLGPGVGIRIEREAVYESAVALAWAAKHSLCLALDRKKFEKLALDSPGIVGDWVEIKEHPTASIATVLQPWPEDE